MMSDPEFVFPYEPRTIYQTVPKKFGHAYFEDDTMTIGNTTTEWITTDQPVEIRE